MDYRIQHTEEMVGADHPMKADTLNRLALVEHYNDGTHGVISDFKAKSPCADVRAFGAKGDGVTDDTSAIQSAIDSGKSVYCPAGTYYISGQLTLPDGIELYGDGRVRTIFKVAAAFTNFAFKSQGDGTTDGSKKRGYLHDFGIDGTQGTSALGGILLDWTYIWTLERIYVYDFFNDNAIGFHVKDSFNINLQSCQAKLGKLISGTYYKHGTGFKVSSSSPSGQNATQITLADCLSQINLTGIILSFSTAADGVLIEQCAVGRNGIGIDFQAGTLYGAEVTKNHIEYNTTGIKGAATLRGLDINGNYFWDTDTAIDLTSISEVAIACNTFNGTTGTRTTLSASNCTSIVWENTNTAFSTAYSGMSLTNTVVNFSPTNEVELAISSNASTPALLKTRNRYVFQNTAGTNVGNFTGVQAGQTLYFRFNDAYTRIYESANIKLKEGGVYGTGSTLVLFTPDGTNFYEVGRDIPKEAVIPTDASSIFKDFTHSVGDVRHNSSPSAGGSIGWVCTTGGTPGVWKNFGAISA